MKMLMRSLAVAALLFSSQAWATPSTTFWTPTTTYVQPFLVPHITYDTYFNDKASYPIITGLTMGVLPWDKLQMEVGFDFFLPATIFNGANASSSAALQFNAKLGVPENAFGEWFPGISAGIYGVGVKSDLSNYNILHGEVQKTFGLGSLVVGGYYGLNDKLMVDEFGKAQQGGLLAAYITPDLAINHPALNKLNFFADLQTGSNSYGAVATGVGIYFTPAIDILTGPVFFLNDKVQPGQQSWMWSVQLDVDLDFTKKPEPTAPTKVQ